MSNRELRLGNRELVRLHDDGTVDEIVLSDENNRCQFHLEQMDESCIWAAIYPEGDEATFIWFYVKDGKIVATHEKQE